MRELIFVYSFKESGWNDNKTVEISGKLHYYDKDK